MSRTLLALALTLNTLAIASGEEPSPSTVAFERLKSLQGTWEAIEKGTGRKSSPTYVLTGRDSVLLELFGGMSTAYHLDKGTLMLTHYCGAGNQPRMRVKSVENGGRHIVFDFYDITNLENPNAYYTNALDVLFRDDGTVELAYRGTTAGRESVQTFVLLRRTAAASAATPRP